MSLRIWLPLTKDLRQQGLSNTTVINNGATFNSAGKLGGCYNFNGSSNYLYATEQGYFGNNYSFSAWIYTTSTSTTQTIGCIRTTVGSGFSLFLMGGKLRIDPGGNNIHWTTSYTYPANTWFHLVVTYDGTTVKYYINGEYKQSYTATISSTYWGNTLSFGASQANGSNYANYLNGRLNDVRVYNHALSQMEVKELAKGLVLHYPLNRQGWGQENLLRGSNVIGSGTTIYGWVSNGSATGMEILSDGSLHYKYNISNSKYIPSITTNTVVPCEFSKTYFYSMDLKFDKAITLGTSVPAHYWVGARNSNSITNTSCNGNLTGIQTQFISNHSGTLPANTWVHITTKFTFPAAATSSGYNYPAIKCFVYGSVLTETITGEVNVWMKNCKVEEGSVETPWCPHVEDTLATTMGLNSTTEYDCSGFGNNGTRTGTFSWTSDTPKYQVSTIFTAEPNAISSVTSFSHLTTFTYNCWIKTNTAHRAYVLMGYQYGNNTSGSLALDSGTSKAGFHYYAYDGGQGNVTIGSNVNYYDNQWHMLTATYDGSKIITYFDGVKTAEGSVSLLTSSRTFSLNQPSGASGKYFKGQMSDARVYATALSADDVLSLYQNSAYIDSSGNVYGAVHEEV